MLNHTTPPVLDVFQFKDEKERREKDLLHAELDFDKCGLAAAQTMAGEDPGKLARTAQQHAQVGRFPPPRRLASRGADFFASVWGCASS